VRNWKKTTTEEMTAFPTPDVRIVRRVSSGNVARIGALHRDGLGSVRAVTSDEGLANETDLYRPFGEQAETVLSVNAVREAKGYIGERYDADAGLLYLNARYYDPRLGMFLQPDWWEVTQAGVGTNRYAYSFNDPINFSDSGGNEVGGNTLQEKEDEENENAMNEMLNDENVPLDERIDKYLEHQDYLARREFARLKALGFEDQMALGVGVYAEAQQKAEMLARIIGGRCNNW
jgi:RHS repeat-associated protein